jgi:hypothetical protein
LFLELGDDGEPADLWEAEAIEEDEKGIFVGLSDDGAGGWKV